MHSDPDRDFQPFMPSGLDFSNNLVVTFLSPISSPSKIPFNSASLDETPTSPLKSTNNLTAILPSATPPLSTGLQLSVPLPENDQSKTTEELPPFISLLSDVRPPRSRPNRLKYQLDHSILQRQHRREYYNNRARRTKRSRFNQHLQYSLKPEFSAWVFWDSRRQ